MADQQKVVYGISNGVSFNDLEQPLTVDLAITFVILDTLNIFLIDWLINWLNRVFKVTLYFDAEYLTNG